MALEPAPRAVPLPTARAAADGGHDLEALYRRFAALAHGIALAHLGSDEADDVVQDVFLRVSEGRARLRDPEALPGWIAATARHAALDRLRARTRRPGSESASVAARAAPEPPRGDDDLRRRVLAAIGSLPEAYREALVLRLVEGLDGPSIAALTGHTPGGVRVHLHRGLELLRPLLAKEGWV